MFFCLFVCLFLNSFFVCHPHILSFPKVLPFVMLFHSFPLFLRLQLQQYLILSSIHNVHIQVIIQSQHRKNRRKNIIIRTTCNFYIISSSESVFLGLLGFLATNAAFSFRMADNLFWNYLFSSCRNRSKIPLKGRNHFRWGKTWQTHKIISAFSRHFKL